MFQQSPPLGRTRSSTFARRSVRAGCTSEKERCGVKLYSRQWRWEASSFLFRCNVSNPSEIRLRDRRQRFHQICDWISSGLHPHFAVVPRADRGARCESPANDEVIYRDDDYRPVGRISGWHDLGWIWKHHHDASSTVLQLPSQGHGGHGYCSRRNSHPA